MQHGRPGADTYTPLATVRALRQIFEGHQDKSFQDRWTLARASTAYRGLQIFCRTMAQVLLMAAMPPLALALLIKDSTLDQVMFQGSHRKASRLR